MNNIFQIEDLFSQEVFDNICDEFEKYPWAFTAKETHPTDVPLRTFWYKELKDSKYIEDTFKKVVEDKFNKKVETFRLYGNGQSHGQSAWVHHDAPQNANDTDWWTIVYYLHKDWKPYYGGHLIFVDVQTDKVIHSVFPHTNSAILFNSKLWHCALEPTVYCTTQRLSIAYKFKLKD